jgi:PAS domain S-box-containing protein
MSDDRKIRILVVDDQPHALQGVSRILRNAGFEPLEAATGEECLKLAADFRPDLVLLDVVLPDIDGRDVCKRLKTDPLTAEAYVVLLSSIRIESESQADGLEHGADGYIARPIPNRELLARVRALLRRKESERRLAEALEFKDKILTTSPVGIAGFGWDGRVVMANEAMAVIVGADREQVLGLNFREFDSWRTSGLLDDAEEVLSTGAEKRKEVNLVTTFGREVWLDCRLARFRVGDEFHLLFTANDVTDGKHVEQEKERLISELQDALAKVKTLSGMLPICGSCKKIRDDQGYWRRLEEYIGSHSDAEFTHSVCPECARKLYPELYQDE